jgi:hypothetical protein
MRCDGCRPWSATSSRTVVRRVSKAERRGRILSLSLGCLAVQPYGMATRTPYSMQGNLYSFFRWEPAPILVCVEDLTEDLDYVSKKCTSTTRLPYSLHSPLLLTVHSSRPAGFRLQRRPLPIATAGPAHTDYTTVCAGEDAWCMRSGR